MKSQLAHVFVIAAVSCGGRGAEGPAAHVDGTTDLSQVEAPAPVADNIGAAPPTEAPVPVDDEIDAPQPTESPLPVDARWVRARPTRAPVPVAGTAKAQTKVEAWRAHAPKRYVISTCGYGLGPPSCSVEAVDEGRLVSRSTRFLPDEPWAVAAIEDGQEPVASLFEQAERSIEGCTTSSELDPVYAYPSQVYFDCGQEGWGVRVTCFEPDTLDGSRCQ